MVFDGSGVYPDIEVPRGKFANVTRALASKLLLFDYATRYKETHAAISAPKQFKLTDAEYDDFVKFLDGKDYSYTTITEKLLNTLKIEATKEKQFTEVQGEYDALRTKLLASKKNDLKQHKQEIKELLENEIVSRYYFEKGRYEAHFKYDSELDKAVNILQDKTLTAAVLQGQGQYKTIGNPHLAMAQKAAATQTTNAADDDEEED